MKNISKNYVKITKNFTKKVNNLKIFEYINNVNTNDLQRVPSELRSTHSCKTQNHLKIPPTGGITMAQMGKDTQYTTQSQSNRWERERKEFESHFGDPRYCRQAWQSVGQMILARPTSKPIPVYDKNGDQTYDSLVESYSYNQLQEDFHNLQSPLDEREAQDYTPTNLEMILMCQAVRARSSVQSATFVRDTVGAKPVDESKSQVTVDDYSRLSDEELELLVQYRAQQQQAQQQDTTPTNDATDDTTD